MSGLKMPSRIALMALATQCISPEQWRELLAARAADASLDPAQWLEDRGYLTPRARHALLMVAEERASKVHDSTELDLAALLGNPSQKPPSDRFRLGQELGRGGLGRVLQAEDQVLGRTVALKFLLESAPPEAAERFRWEARVTGRLEHPNIVPVHETGVLPGVGEYFCMKRILGRDMAQVIHEGRWKLRRLIEAFRDVCRAVAYAHWKGVLHRDLKPANVMLGDFGEVLVVDWGLARASGEQFPVHVPRKASSRVTTRAALDSHDDLSTIEGDILGTPAYMSPEQAQALRDIDARSDVWSLGAILYEILTGRPPFIGPGPLETIQKVIDEPVVPPSSIRPDLPPELEATCLKALAKDRDRRLASASELEAEIEEYLEGTKERDRREALAEAQVAEAKAQAEHCRKLGEQAKEARERAAAMLETVPLHEGVDEKRKLWEVEDRAEDLVRRSAVAFSDADAALISALWNKPDHQEARQLRAELYFDRFLQAEADQDRKGGVLARRVVEQFGDERLQVRLRGEGTVRIETRAWACRCLREGRLVSPAALNTFGFHPWSGRGDSAPNVLPEAEQGEPVRLRVHDSGTCTLVPAPGARVWAFRFEKRDRLLIPVTPAGASAPPVPDAVLDTLFPSSPFRPVGGGLFLGTTPLGPVPLDHGSWLFIVASPDRAPARLPFFVPRESHATATLTLFHPDEIPPGFVHVPAGPFKTQGDPHNSSPARSEIVDFPDAFFDRFPATCGDYAEFLAHIHATSPDRVAAHVPRSLRGLPHWGGSPPHVPTAEWIRLNPELAARLEPLEQGTEAWLETWPIPAVSWIDAACFARWKSLQTGWLLTLPHDLLWEKAARGPDRRHWPWGDHGDQAFCNILRSHADGAHLVPNSDYPTDESPYGIRHMGGQISQFCLNEIGLKTFQWRANRGGSWSRSIQSCRPTYRRGSPVHSTISWIGFRLVAATAL